MRNDAPRRLKLTLIADLDSGGPWEMLWAEHLCTGDTEPVRSEFWDQVYGKKNCWISKGKLFQIEGAETVSQEELKTYPGLSISGFHIRAR